jgi:ATP-binding cassette subfamily F protein 3
MLTLSGITKAYGGRALFADVTLQVNRLDRIGLVGPNGAGKSTLFRIILGEESADAGEISKERNLSFGYLPQESSPVGDETVIEVATAITPEFTKLHRILKAWEADHPVEAQHPDDIHDDVHDRFNELGGYRLEAKAKQILAGLGLRETDFERPAREMSGGWVMRAHLARLLTQEPDLLMLDEPTNHLDLEALLWFQGYLKKLSRRDSAHFARPRVLNNLVGSVVEDSPGQTDSLSWKPRRLRRAARSPRGSTPGRLQTSGTRDRPADGVREPLSRQEHQGDPGPGQAQANRPHGKGRSAGGRR